MKNKKSNLDLSQDVTKRIIKILENHEASNYEKTWFSPVEPFAFNPFSNVTYNAINQILLSDVYLHTDENFKLNRWITFKQAKELNAKVKKGAKSQMIYYRNYLVIDTKSGENITTKFNNASKEEQKNIAENNKLYFQGYLKYYRVFNIDDVENLPENFTTPPQQTNFIKGEKNPTAEQILNNYDIEIRFKESADRCFYNSNDYIVSPKVDNYKDWTNHYKTMFHEFIHSTGNVKRLDRDMSGAQGTKKYAFEELIAELGAAYLCAYCGIDSTITNNAAYIKSWLTCLNNDTSFILKASVKAEEAAKYILLETKVLDYSIKAKQES